tara:strand:- start:315 stop:821 length:507 start_codon:yes stop_codon:yes gene_type:complete
MAFSFKEIRFKFLELIPLLLLFFISLNGNSVIDFRFFSINVHYILIYYWVLKRPQVLGYGFIFLSGIITDVVFGLPIGISALTLLVVASVAAYVRVKTVKISLFYDWMSFIPALLIANFIYFVALYFSDYSIDYLYFIKNSIFTFIFYPFLWLIFGILINITKSESHV